MGSRGTKTEEGAGTGDLKKRLTRVGWVEDLYTKPLRRRRSRVKKGGKTSCRSRPSRRWSLVSPTM